MYDCCLRPIFSGPIISCLSVFLSLSLVVDVFSRSFGKKKERQKIKKVPFFLFLRSFANFFLTISSARPNFPRPPPFKSISLCLIAISKSLTSTLNEANLSLSSRSSCSNFNRCSIWCDNSSVNYKTRVNYYIRHYRLISPSLIISPKGLSPE